MPSKNEKEPLKPCPKCESVELQREHMQWNYASNPHKIVYCTSCGHFEPLKTWNHHPEEDRLRARVSFLEIEVDKKDCCIDALNTDITKAREEIERLKTENHIPCDNCPDINSAREQGIFTPPVTCLTCANLSKCREITPDIVLRVCRDHTALNKKGNG